MLKIMINPSVKAEDSVETEGFFWWKNGYGITILARVWTVTTVTYATIKFVLLDTLLFMLSIRGALSPRYLCDGCKKASSME